MLEVAKIKKIYKKIYLITIAYFVLRLVTGFTTVFFSGTLRDIAWDLNRDILNNLFFVILFLLGIGNGLYLYTKLSKKPSLLVLIASLFIGLLATLIAVLIIWFVSFSVS